MVNFTVFSEKYYYISISRDNHSYNVTVSLLTQSFSALIRLVTELQSNITMDGPHPPFVLQPLPSDREEVYCSKTNT